MLATCRRIRDEGSVYLFRTVHFTTQFSINGFIALRRFNWHATTMAMLESLDIYTASIFSNGCDSWANDLQLLMVGMQNLKFFRISTVFRGDKTDDVLVSPHGEELFSALPMIQAHLLRFGSFVTLRHPKLDFLAWPKPTGDIRLINSVNGVVHYAVKLVADVHLLERNDKILSSTAIRQETLETLSLAHAKDFLCTNSNVDSETQLDYSTKNSTTRHAAHAATSGIEHLVYLTVAERTRLGLKKQLDFDTLIVQARTGLLESKHSPVYSALQIVKASLVKRKAGSIAAKIKSQLHAPLESTGVTPNQHIAAAPTVQATDGCGYHHQHHRYKRGEFIEYMMNHADYLETLDDAFASVSLPGYLAPVKAKKQRRHRHQKSNDVEIVELVALMSKLKL